MDAQDLRPEGLGSTPRVLHLWRLRNIQTVYEALAAIGGFRFLFAPTGLTRFFG